MRHLGNLQRVRVHLGCLGLALILIGLAGPAAADWPPPGTDLPVCTYARDQDRLTVCSDGAGGMYVGWFDRRESYYQEIRVYVQHVLSSGVNDPAWPADGLQVHRGGNYRTDYYSWTGAYPLLIADGAGGAVCVMYLNEMPNDCYANSLHAFRITPSGEVVNRVELFRVGTDCYGGMEGFSAIPDGAGGAKIVYSYGDRTNDITYVHYRADGTYTTPPLTVCDAPYRQYRPKIAADNAGGAIVAWVDDRNQDGGWGYGASDLFAQHILPDDTVDASWTPNGVEICAGVGQILSGFGLTGDGTGGAYLVWRGCNDFVAAQRLLATGDLAWGDWWYGEGDPVIVTDGQGGAYVAFTEGVSVLGHHLIETGDDPDWSWFGKDLGQGYSTPALIPDESGGAYLWSRDGTPRVQHIVLSGRDSAWPYEGVVLSTSTTTGNLQLVDGGAGEIRAAWVDSRNGNQDIYAQGAIDILPNPTSVGPVAPGSCVSTIHPCVTVPVNITRSDAASMRGFSVDIQMSSNLMLCEDLEASITEGTYLNAIGGTHFERTDNGSGSYTIDCVILGQPCGATAPSGDLFHLDLKASGSDGTGTVTVTAVRLRDCDNAPIACEIRPAASMTIDMTPPAAVTDLASVPVVAEHDADGTLVLALTFTPPGDAEIMEVYRAPYGTGDGVSAYPEYNDVVGAGSPTLPSYPPGGAWMLTDVSGSGAGDEVATRGAWTYTVFTKDACGNVSAVSNLTPGTLNYILGDFSPPPGGGNNIVDGLDVSALGGHYGATLVMDDAFNYLDIGPTLDGSPRTMPTTDDRLNFEDLMIVGMTYNPTGLLREGPVVTQPASVIGTDLTRAPELTLKLDPTRRPGDLIIARLFLSNNVDQVKGIHALISFDASSYEMVGADPGTLLENAEVFWTTLADAQGTWLDAVMLGDDRTFSGSGEVARLSFRRIGVGALPSLTQADLRDRDNRAPSVAANGGDGGGNEIVGGGPVAAGRLELAPIARPNPFSGRTEISFRLPADGPADLRIYDVAGRLARTLTSGSLSAGDHVVSWDGRLDSGTPAGRGVYFYELRSGKETYKRKLLLIQ